MSPGGGLVCGAVLGAVCGAEGLSGGLFTKGWERIRVKRGLPSTLGLRDLWELRGLTLQAEPFVLRFEN